MPDRLGSEKQGQSSTPMVLIGTFGALRHWTDILLTQPTSGKLVGCVVVSDGLEAAQAPEQYAAPVLGLIDDLADILAQEKVGLAYVSLPLGQQRELMHLQEQLRKLGLAWRFLPTLEDQLAGRLVPGQVLQLDHTPGTPGTLGIPGSAPSTGPSDPRIQGQGPREIANLKSPIENSPTPANHADQKTSVGASSAARITLGSPLWSVDPENLLDRRPHPLDEDAIRSVLTDKTVLITGAGGSIGSELARIVCRFEPRKLVLVERSENALFEIDREIARRFPKLNRAAVLHDVTDAPRTLGVIMAQKPNTIFHAAAHKHVPMMEGHPAAAVENNFYGTRAIADAACKEGVDRFVMISSDKAVRPSSVMGATKRLAELYIQYLTSRSETVFSMVRFGNVLGSACSVLPIWAEQLSRGGPITVTHPAMTRYFMTIPEAAGLVIQSAAFAGLAGGGEVFLLDMGKPIRILDLAQRFIRAQGLEPQRDVKVEFTGIRPGEKLFEELAYESEEMIPTPHPSVRIWKTAQPEPMRMRHIIAAFDRLRGVSDGKGRHHWQHIDKREILDALHAAVPEMVAPADAALPVELPAPTPTRVREAG